MFDWFWGLPYWVRVVIASVVLAILWELAEHVWKRWRRGKAPGFLDFVKEPDLWDDELARIGRDRKAADEAEHWDDAKVEVETRWFVLRSKNKDEDYARKLSLLKVRERTYPTLLMLLRDASIHPQLVAPTKWRNDEEMPLERIAFLFDENLPEDLPDAMRPFLSVGGATAREIALRYVSRFCREEDHASIRAAISRAEDHELSKVLWELGRADESGRLPAGLKHELFPLLLSVTPGFFSRDAWADVLYRCNHKGALAFALAPDALSPNNPRLELCLKILAKEPTAAPVERLVALVEEIDATDMKHPNEYNSMQALMLLGMANDARARACVEAHLDAREERIATGAALAWLQINGLGKLHELTKLLDEDEVRTGGRNDVLARIDAVEMLDAEVRNGGFEQYFFNSSGNRWRFAKAGLEAMGSSGKLAILQEAIAVFGRAEPSTDRAIRHRQLSRLGEKGDEAFGKLARRYYDDSENVMAMSARYAVANKHLLPKPQDHPESDG